MNECVCDAAGSRRLGSAVRDAPSRGWLGRAPPPPHCRERAARRIYPRHGGLAAAPGLSVHALFSIPRRATHPCITLEGIRFAQKEVSPMRRLAPTSMFGVLHRRRGRTGQDAPLAPPGVARRNAVRGAADGPSGLRGGLGLHRPEFDSFGSERAGALCKRGLNHRSFSRAKRRTTRSTSTLAPVPTSRCRPTTTSSTLTPTPPGTPATPPAAVCRCGTRGPATRPTTATPGTQEGHDRDPHRHARGHQPYGLARSGPGEVAISRTHL